MGRAASVLFSITPISTRFPITKVYAKDDSIKAAELMSTSSHKVKGVQGGLRHGNKLRELGGERKERLVGAPRADDAQAHGGVAHLPHGTINLR